MATLNKIVEIRNAKRAITLFNIILLMQCLVILTVDIYHWRTGLWETDQYQFYNFINRLCSLPLVILTNYFNKRFVRKQDLPFMLVMVINIVLVTPYTCIFYYLDLMTYQSSFPMIIYLLSLSFVVKLPKLHIIAFVSYFAILYYGMLWYVDISYADNRSLYINGACAIFLFYKVAIALYKRNIKEIGQELLLQQKKSELDELNLKLKRANTEILAKNEVLHDSNDSLSNFAHVAAHDLKTPLRTISGFSELLSRKYEDKIEDRDKMMFEFMNTGCRDLTNIVDSLLEFSKVSDNKSSQFEEVSLNDVADKAIELLEGRIKEKNAKIYVAPNLPRVIGIEGLLQQLFMNLLNNGIKFSKEGVSPMLEIGYHKSINESSFVEIFIKDQGIGIPADQLDNIFQLFTKLHRTEEYEGSGIGLATCRKIVEKHKGEIRVQSQEGNGSTFLFTLPLI